MKVHLAFVPPGGGETEYAVEFDMPAVPQAGDYISIIRTSKAGTEDFRVKRTLWQLGADDASERTEVKDIWVECECALSGTSSDDHKAACDRYKQQTSTLIELDTTMY